MRIVTLGLTAVLAVCIADSALAAKKKTPPPATPARYENASNKRFRLERLRDIRSSGVHDAMLVRHCYRQTFRTVGLD
jgi:hypothetical protein